MRAEGVLFCGGGTGGHVHPGLAVATELRARGVAPLRWIGDPQRIEAKLVPAADIPLLPLGLSRPRLLSLRWWWTSLRQAVAVHRELKARPPLAVVALGGYAALLPGLLAPFHRRPVVVMEQNALPGRTNRLLSRLATAVVTQFDEATARLPAGKVRQLGNPVRPIAARPRGAAGKLRVLVVGGSLAAKSLNDLVSLAAAELARIPDLELIHVAGDDDRQRMANVYAAAGVQAEVLGFVSDMPALYERIDLAVARAGATTVSELACAGIGALFVPLPWAADDHQTANARAVAAVGGALVLPQAETRPEDLARLLAELARDRSRIAALGTGARTIARPDAAQRVADLVQAVAAARGMPLVSAGNSSATEDRSKMRRDVRNRLMESLS